MPYKDLNKRREKAREYRKKYYWNDPEKSRTKVRTEARTFRSKIKQEFLDEYGKRCYCCGESTLEFLTVAHLDDSGAAHRRKIGGSQYVLTDLKKQNWPKENIGILCMNCQFATTHKRTCPHANRGSLNL